MGETGLSQQRMRVAVIGSGVSGLSCAWLLSERHEVTVYEAAPRLGGHSNTVETHSPWRDDAAVPVDTGFIVYNEANYPNLTALFAHLGAPTKLAEMSFGVSLDDGRLEYGSATPAAIWAQPSNLLSPRFWSMLRDLVRFYRSAPADLGRLEASGVTLGQYLDAGGYGAPFQEDHLLPQIGAIWSSTSAQARDYPAAALIRFFDNHGLLNLLRRPVWRTVDGGSREYVKRLSAAFAPRIRLSRPVTEVRRGLGGGGGGVEVRDASGAVERFDRVVIATHADQALAMLAEPSADEGAVLGAFRYSKNLTVLHADASLMPRRRRAWSAWNHIGRRGDARGVCVTYWMNRLQSLPGRDLFVTLNPCRPIAPDTLIRSEVYTHPLFDAAAIAAQSRLWALQGRGGVWFCGAYFGAGFHEDGLQAGLAVAEQLGGVRRPWTVPEPSGRIQVTGCAQPTTLAA